MVFGHSWKAATSTSLSSTSSSSSPPPSFPATNNNNIATQYQYPGSSAFSSTATQQQQQQQQQRPPIFGIMSPPNAAAATGGGLFSHNPHVSSSSSSFTTTATNVNIIGGGGMGIMSNSTTSATAPPPDFESLLVNSASLLSSMGRASTSSSNNIIGGGGGATPIVTATGGIGRGVGGDGTMMMMMMMKGGGGIMKNENNSTSSYEAEAAAHRLLAREGLGFDSADLGRRARELERRVAADDAGPGAGGGGIRGGSRRRRSNNRWNNDNGDDDVEEEKKSSGGSLSFNGMNDDEEDSDHHSSLPMTLQELLASHHNHCVESAIRTSRQRAEKLSRQRVEERLQSDWMKRKQVVLGQSTVGHRFLLGSYGRSSSGGVGGGFSSNGGSGQELVPITGGALDSSSTSIASPFVYSGIVPSPQIIPSSAERLVKSHLASIEGRLATNITTSTSSTPASTTTSTAIQGSSANTNAALSLLTSLEEGLKDFALAEATTTAPTPGITPECLSGYSNAFALVRSIVNCRIGLGFSDASTSSSSSSIMISTMATIDNANNEIAPLLAANVMGTCHFFAQQFASHVREMVQEAELGGWTMSSSNIGDSLSSSFSGSTVRDICAFTTLTLGKEVAEGRGGVWPHLFYCLRCGDANAANFFLQRFSNVARVGSSVEDLSVVDPAVSDLVSQLSSLQQNQATVFTQRQFLYPTQSMFQSRRQVADLYNRIQMRSTSLSSSGGEKGEDMNQCLYYRNSCLAMLGGSDSISETPELESSGLIIKTVEDYLYMALWHALHATEMNGAGVTLVGDEGSGIRGLAEAVTRLSVLINQWGPSYFEQDEDFGGGALHTGASEAVALATRGGGSVASAKAVTRSGGWAYALPLLAAQQYATALAYLAEAGGGIGLAEATHVGIVMDAAGLSVSDFTLDEQSGISKSSQQALLPMLVASYSASLQGSDARAALMYLALMTGKGKFVKEQVQRLILETRQFEVFAGKVETSGSRSSGALDLYFTKSEVSSLLVDSACHAIRVGKPADAAELLVLAGRFSALFALLNRELASCLTASSLEGFEKRQFWFNVARQFHTVHLTSGRTYVQNTLDAEGNMSLGNTFQLLMNLMVFFDRCRENQWEGAWALIDDLQLMPRTESEISVRVEAFRALDNCVRQVFHHVVLAAMEALCHIYNVLKQGRAGVSSGQHNTTDQSLNEIQTRARLLVTFARLLNLPSFGNADTDVQISQLEKTMM